MDVSPSFVAEHSTAAAWLIGALGTCALSLGGLVIQRLTAALRQAGDDLKFVKETLLEAVKNHMTHTEQYSMETRDGVRELGTKFDLLIEVMGRKA
jgi:hypothetical protein